MARYKKVNYKQMAGAVRIATAKAGCDLPLIDVVNSLQQYTGLCLDVKRIQRLLGSRCVERVEQKQVVDCLGHVETVTAVRTWVVALR